MGMNKRLKDHPRVVMKGSTELPILSIRLTVGLIGVDLVCNVLASVLSKI